MKRDIADIHRTLEYAQSHDLARQMLPVALVGILLGLFFLTPLDGRDVEGRNALLGWLVISGSLAFLAVVIYRRQQPTVPSVVVSPQGVIFRDVSETAIAWNDIVEVDEALVSAARDFTSTRVVKLVLTPYAFEAVTGRKIYDSVVASAMNSEIYISYYHSVPVDELRRALRLRWHAFSYYGKRALRDASTAFGVEDAASKGSHEAGHAARPSASNPVQRVRRFEGLRAFGALVSSSSPGQLVASGIAAAGILLLLTNNVGLWSTGAQERGRARAAEWRATQERWAREQKAVDEQVRRTRELWDRK